MAQLNDTLINGDLTVNGGGSITNVEELENSIVNVNFLKNHADYIVEQAVVRPVNTDYVENTSWCFYRKYNSGILDIFGYSRMSANYECSTSSWFSGYETPYLWVWQNYPVQFLTAPFFQVSMMGADAAAYIGDVLIIYGNSSFGGDYNTLNVAPPGFKLFRGTTRLFGHPQFTWRALGRWKIFDIES